MTIIGLVIICIIVLYLGMMLGAYLGERICNNRIITWKECFYEVPKVIKETIDLYKKPEGIL